MQPNWWWSVHSKNKNPQKSGTRCLLLVFNLLFSLCIVQVTQTYISYLFDSWLTWRQRHEQNTEGNKTKRITTVSYFQNWTTWQRLKKKQTMLFKHCWQFNEPSWLHLREDGLLEQSGLWQVLVWQKFCVCKSWITTGLLDITDEACWRDQNWHTL